jgi:hypothetical protein
LVADHLRIGDSTNAIEVLANTGLVTRPTALRIHTTPTDLLVKSLRVALSAQTDLLIPKLVVPTFRNSLTNRRRADRAPDTVISKVWGKLCVPAYFHLPDKAIEELIVVMKPDTEFVPRLVLIVPCLRI